MTSQGNIDEIDHRFLRDPAERRTIARALIAAVALHATVLVARMPNWGEPVRVDSLQQEQAMKIQFLKPPPPPPKQPEKPPEPEKKKIPKPDTTPDEPEPEKPAPPPPPEPATPAVVQQPGPVRVAAGQGPGLIKKVEPQYPAIARAARVEGTVIVDAVIRSDGSVSDVTILKSSNRLFDQACLDAVRQWRFTPGSRDVILTVTVNFTLR